MTGGTEEDKRLWTFIRREIDKRNPFLCNDPLEFPSQDEYPLAFRFLRRLREFHEVTDFRIR